ncbi:MAG: O-antigen translocase [Bacteroidales bacterium]|nr:O-antigen translocase [Bacteroidales bacterium]
MSESKSDIQATTKEQTSNYRSVFKATSLFGGVQVYQILIGIIRSKVIAVLLGPAGMGIQGLYQSTLDLIKSVTALGLEQSAVRDISEANGSKNEHLIARTVAVTRRLIWLTGMAGLLLTLVLSPWLSTLTFGNRDYTWGFVILSSTLLFNQICSGQKVLLQGLRRLKDLAKTTAIGSTIGLLVSIPLYYWIGVKGIVPTMVLTSVAMLLLSWHYSRKVKIEEVKVTTREAISEGRSMMKMGIAMSVSGILVALSAYVLRWFIRQQGGVEEVGLFTAGFIIVSTYIGMIFSAMSTDYYPRLAAVNKDNSRCREIINQQAEVAILISSPIIVFGMVFMPFIIRLIYSESFLPANHYILIALLGMMFKVVSWSVSFVFLAKAESRLFMINETVTNLYGLAFNLLGYWLGGLAGLGISYAAMYFIYMIQVYIIARKRYGFGFSLSFKRVYGILFLMVIACFALIMAWQSAWVYLPSIVILAGCSFYSFYELNKRVQVMQYVKQRFKRDV